MIAEIGIVGLIIALLFAMTMACALSGRVRMSMPPLVVGQCVFVGVAYLCLTWCFITDDFSVRYVLMNSSVHLPWFYKCCAVWGGHEGSLLLWVTILTGWILVVYLFPGQLEAQFHRSVISILSLLNAGFLLFMLMTSNPFLRQFAMQASQAQDLNPLLQDPGFLFHPPMLYMGYVGFAVAFAFAIAVLLQGKLQTNWVQWVKPWTLAAWCCLTVGITLGSWWPYRE